MNSWDTDDGRGGETGPGGVLVLMGLALGAAAALLLTTKQGRQVCDQIAERTSGLKSQAADALAQGREKLIVAVEEQTAPPPDSGSPVREKTH